MSPSGEAGCYRSLLEQDAPATTGAALPGLFIFLEDSPNPGLADAQPGLFHVVLPGLT
jgi:hypothetical protein